VGCGHPAPAPDAGTPPSLTVNVHAAVGMVCYLVISDPITIGVWGEVPVR
jgi:hypothetical protein